MTREEVEALLAIAGAATPGPWTVKVSPNSRTRNIYLASDDEIPHWLCGIPLPANGPRGEKELDADAALICASRTAVPLLCAEVLALEGVFADLREDTPALAEAYRRGREDGMELAVKVLAEMADMSAATQPEGGLQHVYRVLANDIEHRAKETAP